MEIELVGGIKLVIPDEGDTVDTDIKALVSRSEALNAVWQILFDHKLWVFPNGSTVGSDVKWGVLEDFNGDNNYEPLGLLFATEAEAYIFALNTLLERIPT